MKTWIMVRALIKAYKFIHRGANLHTLEERHKVEEELKNALSDSCEFNKFGEVTSCIYDVGV